MVEDELLLLISFLENHYFAVSFRLPGSLKNAGETPRLEIVGTVSNWLDQTNQAAWTNLVCLLILLCPQGVEELGNKIILDLILKLQWMMRVSSMYHEIVTKCSNH